MTFADLSKAQLVRILENMLTRALIHADCKRCHGTGFEECGSANCCCVRPSKRDGREAAKMEGGGA